MLWLVVMLCVAPTPAFAWGFAAHRLITTRAIVALPPELRPFFERHQARLLTRVTEPDVRRESDRNDGPNHFLDFGVREYGPYPFSALPREYGAAIEKFGTDTLRKNGLLPWRLAEEFGNLRRAFGGGAVRRAGAGQDAVVTAAGVAAHYIQDAFQPLHATNNFDGQHSGNNGIHARFERDLVARYQSQLTWTMPARVQPMTHARDAAFDALLSGHQAVGPLLEADTEGRAGRPAYDDAYFDRFFVRVRPMLDARLSEAATATAALITGAWEQAGRPGL